MSPDQPAPVEVPCLYAMPKRRGSVWIWAGPPGPFLDPPTPEQMFTATGLLIGRRLP